MHYYFKDILDTYRNVWFETAPLNLQALSDDSIRRKYNDRALIQLKQKLMHLLKSIDDFGSFDSSENKKMIQNEVEKFVVDILGIDQKSCDVLFGDAYYDCTRAFVKRVRDLTDMSFEDIQQALRNVWVMNVLQVYFGQKVGLTNAVFAYSMLYPLTDNYLDDDGISKDDKKSFNERFYKKIKSGEDKSKNDRERLIFHMIDLIGQDYPRDVYPKVYESLLAILDGQNKSLDQQGMTSIYDKDLLSYTFYKGGTSVLADAYLVKGDLTNSEAMMAFGYGVILQIADDIQDIEEDLFNGHMTLANTQCGHSNLDGFYLKYQAFIRLFFNQYFSRENDQQEALWQLLKKSVELLVFEGITANKKYLTKRTYKLVLAKGYFSRKSFMRHNKVLADQMNQLL